MRKALTNILNANEIRVLRTVYESGPVSRVSLSRMLNLTRGMITLITKQLLTLGYVAEVGKGMSTRNRGRREVLLHVQPNAAYIISIHIALRYISFGIVNLNGEIIAKQMITFQYSASPASVLEPMFNDLEKLLKEKVNDSKLILGVGIAIPGIIKYKEGIACERTLTGWENFKLREYVENRLGYPVFLENDVKTITLGEYQFGTGNHVRNMVCLWLEDGIGSGIINNGRIIRGVTSSAGEIGFCEFILNMPSKKSILSSEQPRFWGDLVSFTNIKAAIKQGLDEGWTSILTKQASIDDFIRAIDSGDPLALYIIRLLGQVVGKVCLFLIYSFNPQVLLLSGPLFHRAPLLVDEIRKKINTGVLCAPIDAVDIRTSRLGEDGVTIGCAALVLDQMLNASVMSLENSQVYY